MDPEIEAFRQFCDVNVSCDAQGRECQLNVTANVTDPRTGQPLSWSRSINLRPLIKIALAKLREWHQREHGHLDTAVSGFGDFISRAASIAKSIAENKTIRTIYNEVKDNSTVRAALEVVPGGGAIVAAVDESNKIVKIAEKAHDTLVKAMQGDDHAKAKIAALKDAAESGDPKAAATVHMMSIMKNKIDQRGSLYTPDVYGSDFEWVHYGSRHGNHFYRRGLGMRVGAPLSVVGRSGSDHRRSVPFAGTPHRPGTPFTGQGRYSSANAVAAAAAARPHQAVYPPAQAMSSNALANMTDQALQNQSQPYNGDGGGGGGDGGGGDDYGGDMGGNDFGPDPSMYGGDFAPDMGGDFDGDADMSGDETDMAVQGWTLNVPYRGYLESAIAPGPFAYLREAYKRGAV